MIFQWGFLINISAISTFCLGAMLLFMSVFGPFHTQKLTV